MAYYVGSLIVGDVTGSQVKLRWVPKTASTDVKCVPKHPNLPKEPYEATFESFDFINRICAPSFPLQNSFSTRYTQEDWLDFTVMLQRLK